MEAREKEEVVLEPWKLPYFLPEEDNPQITSGSCSIKEEKTDSHHQALGGIIQIMEEIGRYRKI